MDDAEYERQKQRVLHLADEWIKPLGLAWWDVELGYERENFEVNGKPAPETLACCTAHRKLTPTAS